MLPLSCGRLRPHLRRRVRTRARPSDGASSPAVRAGPLQPPKVCKPYSVRGIMRKNAIPFIRRNEVRRIFRIFAVPEQDFPATPEQAIVIPASGIPILPCRGTSHAGRKEFRAETGSQTTSGTAGTAARSAKRCKKRPERKQDVRRRNIFRISPASSLDAADADAGCNAPAVSSPGTCRSPQRTAIGHPAVFRPCPAR